MEYTPENNSLQTATDLPDVTEYVTDVPELTPMDRQLLLEQGMHLAGAARFRKEVEAEVSGGNADRTAGGQAVMWHWRARVVEVIVRFLNRDATLLDPITTTAISGASTRGKAKAGSDYRSYLEGIPPDEVALICMKELVKGIAQAQGMGTTRTNLARSLESAAKIAKLREMDANLEHDIKKQAKREGKNGIGVTKLIDHAIENTLHWERWETKAKHKLAATLIYAVAQRTGMVALTTVRRGKRSEVLIKPSDELITLMQDKHARIELASAIVKPFVVAPKDWTSNSEGAFHGTDVRDVRLVKTPSKEHIRRLHEATQAGTMDTVYAAVNAAQRTAWHINQPVLEVIQWAWENGDTLNGTLPLQESLPLPPRPPEDAPETAWDEWKPKAHEIHNQNRLSFSKRLKTASILATAEEYASEEEFFYAYTLDFRGRMYPIQNGLQPQGEDMEKALLTFADGVELTPAGMRWLKIHGANEFGVDKVSYQDRVNWVDDNKHNIQQSARNPKSNLWWTQADNPWKFLAFCFEFDACNGDMYERGSAITHLPCSVDGTCNGLQHLSAMARDSQGASAVNLTPGDKPSDIYGVVADIAKDILRDLVQSGDEKAGAAGDLLELGVTRKETKRSVMVIPYGGTMRACLNYVEEALRDRGLELAVVDKDRQRAVKGLGAKAVWDAMDEPLGTAKGIMAWLQKWSRVLAKVDRGCGWTAPSGFPCYQKYMKVKTYRFRAAEGEAGRIEVQLVEPTDTIDSSRQASGIAPNVVHSYDAAHMMDTVERCAELGITDFALVHDSFGTHASNVGVMQDMLRASFKDIYSEDVPASLAAEFMFQSDTPVTKGMVELGVEGLPELGEWNPEAIMGSDYFFS